MTKSEVAPLVRGTVRRADRLAMSTCRFSKPARIARWLLHKPAVCIDSRYIELWPRLANRSPSLWPRNCHKERTAPEKRRSPSRSLEEPDLGACRCGKLGPYHGPATCFSGLSSPSSSLEPAKLERSRRPVRRRRRRREGKMHF
jgi:hypothetical protein